MTDPEDYEPLGTAVVDGKDALLIVIIRPEGQDVSIECHAHPSLSRLEAADILARFAQRLAKSGQAEAS